MPRKERASRLRSIRLAKRSLAAILIFIALCALRGIWYPYPWRAAAILFGGLPALYSSMAFYYVRMHRYALDGDFLLRLVLWKHAMEAEQEALGREQKRLAAIVGNQANRAIREQAREYFEAGEWVTKAAACEDIAKKFNRAPKTVERWITMWGKDLDRDDA